MNRLVVFSALIVVGGLSLAVSGQAPAGPSAKAVAATKIEKIKDNLYIITGSSVEDTTAFSGGNVAVFITDDGVTIVDAKLPGFGPTIVDRVKSVTNKPITRIINTHTHNDHTGSNEFFGASIENIVQDNTKANMAKMAEFQGAKAQFLPKKTYTDTLTIGSGKDEIDLYYFGPATPTATASSSSRRRERCTSATSSRGRPSGTSTQATAAASSASQRRSRRRSRP